MFGRDSDVPWYLARRDATGLAPDPATTREAVIQVYAARAVAWRGAVAVHTWIVVKPADAPRYTRYEVIGFGVANGAPAVRVDRTGPDNYWFGARPELVLDRRDKGVDALIDKVRDAVGTYPYPHDYRAWPGPNSNTFTAYVARQVPELRLALPSNALGKDFLPGGAVMAAAPSGTGYQMSLYGIAGILVARAEGIEVNLLGLALGIDFQPPGLKLPGVGTLGFSSPPKSLRRPRRARRRMLRLSGQQPGRRTDGAGDMRGVAQADRAHHREPQPRRREHGSPEQAQHPNGDYRHGHGDGDGKPGHQP